MSVVGELVNNTVILIDSLANITSLLPSTSQGALTSPLRGQFKVLIIITRFDNGRAPLTVDQAQQTLLNPARPFLNNCSYGNVRLDPQSRVVGPIAIGPRRGCPDDTTIDVWRAAAASKVRCSFHGMRTFVSWAVPAMHVDRTAYA